MYVRAERHERTWETMYFRTPSALEGPSSAPGNGEEAEAEERQQGTLVASAPDDKE